MMLERVQFKYLALAICVAVIASLPLFADNYVTRVAISMTMFSAMAISWNFIGGFTGYPSFATAAFFGIGCYVGALAQRAGMPTFIAWTLATFFVAVAVTAIILAFGAQYIPRKRATTATIVPPIKYGLKNLKNDTPELKNATTSVLLANLDVNQMTDRNKKSGNKRFAKYIVKSK